MWELDYIDSWAPKNFWTVVLNKTVESPLDCKEIQPVHPKGNQPWIFIRSTDAEAETPILWLPDAKNWLIWKDPDAGKDWRREEKGTTEDEMVGWHDPLNDMILGKLLELVMDREGWRAAVQGLQRVRDNWAAELNWWPRNPPTRVLWEIHNSKRDMNPMFIAAHFMIARTWKKSKCPLTDEWIKNIFKILGEHML